MLTKAKASALALICLVAILVTSLINPSHSKYVLSGVEDIIETILTGPKLKVIFQNYTADGVENVYTHEVKIGTKLDIKNTVPSEKINGMTPPASGATFQGWMNASGDLPDSITVTRDIVLSAKWKIENKYHIYFIDTNGALVHQEDFTKGSKVTISDQEAKDLAETAQTIGTQLTDEAGGSITVTATWEGPYAAEGIYTMDIGADVIVNLALSFGTGNGAASIRLEPVIVDKDTGKIKDENNDGLPDEYILTGANIDNTNINITIPESVLGGEIVGISDAAFAGFESLHVIRIPKTVTTIGSNLISTGSSWAKDETITIYYDGSYDEWDDIIFSTTWDNNLGDSTRIFFLNDGDRVDSSQGYCQKTSSGWDYYPAADFDDDKFNKEYSGYCDCKCDTTGDTAHVYVDENNNVLGRNDKGTPVNNVGTPIKQENSGTIFNKKYYLTDGTIDTYERYRPDKDYWPAK